MLSLTERMAPVIRSFQASDLECILNRDGAQITPEAILVQASNGPAFTAVLDDAPIGCAGLVLPWPGLGMAWMVLSEEMSGHGLWLTRTVKWFLEDMAYTYELHRIEAVALEDSLRNQKWLQALGFTSELNGRARQFLSDQRTVIRYEWVKE